MRKFVINRDVTQIECPWLAHHGIFSIEEDTVVYEREDQWHCANGPVISLQPSSCYFEVPEDALTPMAEIMGTCHQCLREWIPLEDVNICQQCSGVYS